MGIFIDSSETAVIGKIGIWMAIPIGWALADITGLACMGRASRRIARELS